MIQTIHEKELSTDNRYYYIRCCFPLPSDFRPAKKL